MGGYYACFDPLYWLMVLPPLALMILAQISVRSAYSTFSRRPTGSGLTGAQAARMILAENGIMDVGVECISGSLTDHYDPRKNVIRLSEEVYHGATVAAVGIAAHETGHALQYAKGYFPIRIRQSLVPLTRFGPLIGLIMAFVGAYLANTTLIWAGLALFASVFVFQVCTLPVEFNASRRALAAIREGNLLGPQETEGARRVLTAAAMTYVASMLQSLMTLLYYIIRLTGNRRN